MMLERRLCGGLLHLARDPDDGEAVGVLCRALGRLDRTPVADPVLAPVIAGLRSLLRDGRLAQVAAMGTLHDACGLDPRTADALLTAAAPRDEVVALADHLATEAEHAPKTPPAAGAPAWPTLDRVALRGLAGQVVAAGTAHGEADSAAILVSFLAAFGSAVGSGPHCLVGATRHGANLFAVLVGQSAKARKGDSWSPVRAIMAAAEPAWAANRVLQGLSSGEGVIAAVRDPTYATKGDEQVMVDAGVSDKRLLALAPEFARILAVMQRDGSTLSAVLREGWDAGDLRVVTKTPTAATDAHVSILGHVTVDELRRELTSTDAASGFANRFLWVAVKRGRLMADPPPFTAAAVAPLAQQVRAAIESVRPVGTVTRDPEASVLWRELYPELSRERPGLAGAILSRHEAQAVRLSMLYALLDRATRVGVAHLEAAIAVLDYVATSAVVIFGDELGDPVADEIRRRLERSPAGLTRTEIRDVFGRNLSGARIGLALARLEAAGRAQPGRPVGDGGGRPAEVWRATPYDINDRNDQTPANGGVRS